ncbi:MAG: ATP-binding protein [Oscillospiraceae bacterium]
MISILNRLKENKVAIILFLAVMTTAALMLLVRLPGFGTQTDTATVPEQDGVYDLTDIDDLAETAITLNFGSTYYPNVLLTPETAETAVPESTNRYDAIRADYLSQRFIVELPDADKVYALTFKLSGRHAMRAYVNGVLVGQSGRLGITKQDTEVWENNLTCYASPTDGKMDVILQSAQFYHFRSGAHLASLRIQEAAGYSNRPTGEAKGFFMMGSLLCAAVLLLCIFLLLRRTLATLYFALACLAMALRVCIQSQAWTFFPFISGNLSFMLEYLSVVLLTVFLSLYLGQYITTKVLRAIRYTAIIGSVIYGLLVLFADSVFYTFVLHYYQALLVICIVPGVVGLFWTMRQPTWEQFAALYGIAVFYLAAVSDIIMYSDVFGEPHKNAPVSEAAMLVFVLAQTVSLFLMNHRVIAETRESERRLAAEKEALEELNRLKTEFLANVSHELKTPLTVVSGYAQVARSQLSGQENEAVREKMSLISSEADRLALMVGQILDVTRIEEGRMVLEKRLCHIDELIYQAVGTYFPIMNKNENHLAIRADHDLPEVDIDPRRITQVLVNLIANAVRHTIHGMITIAAEQRGNFVEVSVADTGTGIAPDALLKLFTRFYSQSTGIGKTGTGLGLYISKNFVEEHGGKIRAESVLGEGTKITFSLPCDGQLRQTLNKTTF